MYILKNWQIATPAYIIYDRYLFQCITYSLFFMKTLIENSLYSQKLHQHEVDSKSASFNKIEHIASVFSASISQKKFKLATTSHINNNSLSRTSCYFRENKKEGHQESANTLRQKHNSQQVSSLYSEHIYKSVQRDYFHEAQIQKYKTMLNIEKKQKLKLLADQNQWKVQKAKLIEEKQIILFALNSLTVKLDTEANNKKCKELRRKTAQILKNKFYVAGSSKQKKKQIRFRTDPESGKSHHVRNSTQFSQFQDNQVQEKLKKIRMIKDQLNIYDAPVLNTVKKDQDSQVKLLELQVKYLQTQEKVQNLEVKITQFNALLAQKQRRISEVQTSEERQKKQKEQYISKLQISEEKNKNSLLKIKQLEERIEKILDQKQKMKEKAEEVEKELKVKQQQFQSREDKQKHCVKILQKFSMDLKLSDDKINEFLKTQMPAYTQQNNDVSRSKKTYNQHLSYILHLHKKKQCLYEGLVNEFKQKIKDNEFLISILEKKLSNFTQYQQKLRDIVSVDSDKSTLVKAIIKFGF